MLLTGAQPPCSAVEYSIQFVRTSLERPFLASPEKALCIRLRRASLRASSALATISDVTVQEPRRRLSSFPTDWANANLPACSNICEHPTICVDTGDCQCVLSSCAPRQRFPFASSAHSPFLSFPPPPSAELSLVEMVSQSSWRNVLRPQASRFVGAQVPFPRVHVAPLPPSDQNMLSEDGLSIDFRGKLRDHHCFTADTQMEKAVSLMGVRREDMETTFIPSYQQGDGGHQLLERTWEFSRDTLDGFDASKVIIPFTHDFGQCLAFEWCVFRLVFLCRWAWCSSRNLVGYRDVWHMRERQGLRVHPFVRSTTAWSVMGDLNSACYRPHQDVMYEHLSFRLEAYRQGSDGYVLLASHLGHVSLRYFSSPSLQFPTSVQCATAVYSLPLTASYGEQESSTEIGSYVAGVTGIQMTIQKGDYMLPALI